MTDKRKLEILQALHIIYDPIRAEMSPLVNYIQRHEDEQRLQREKIMSLIRRKAEAEDEFSKFANAEKALVVLADSGFKNQAFTETLKTVKHHKNEVAESVKLIEKEIAESSKPLSFDDLAHKFIESVISTLQLIDELEKTDCNRCVRILREIVRKMKLQCTVYPVVGKLIGSTKHAIRCSIDVRTATIKAIQEEV